MSPLRSYTAERWRAASMSASVTGSESLPLPTAASSSALSATRASPSAAVASACRAASSACTPLRCSSSESARRRAHFSASGESLLKTTRWQRELMALLSEKDGFSVVAPMREMVPFSMSESSASCCAFDQRWISSTNRMVPCCEKLRVFCARVSSSRSSFTPALAAESVRKCRFVFDAITLAIDVLPHPGGPHKMSDGSLSCASAWRMVAFRAASWPTSSSMSRGRMRSARGWCP
mmetsp:Transcript_24988/g.77863  ORF Transcript_24988/g.77863 Transcript_24988/m.77863 type:complete len:236 (-) Transcript_24988:134-841(-)